MILNMRLFRHPVASQQVDLYVRHILYYTYHGLSSCLTSLKWMFERSHLVKNATGGPEVTLAVVGLVFPDLRAEIIGSAHAGASIVGLAPAAAVENASYPKVSQLDPL